MRLRNGVPVVMGVLLAQLLLAGPGHAQIQNDDCAQALPITDGTYVGTNVGATDDGDAPGCPSGSAGPDVWYLYTATCDGLLEVDTCGSSLDTNLSIQEPGCTGVEVACNEDACGPEGAEWQSRVTTPVAAGEQLLIRVAGWNGETGPFELHVSCGLLPVRLPARDRCDEAFLLDAPSVTLGSTVGAGYDPSGDQSKLGLPRTRRGCGRWEQNWERRIAPPGRWYKVTGTGNTLTADVVGTRQRLSVYCGGCDPTICVTGAFSTSESWCSRAGQTYWIWIYPDLDGIPADYQLSLFDDGTACYDAVDCTPVEVVDTFVADDGDHDGWADSSETVELGFTVTNSGAIDVTNLVARLSTDDPKIAGIAEAEVHVGDVAAGRTRRAPGAFVFRVADVERTTESEEFSAEFRVSMRSDQFQDLEPRRCSVGGNECTGHADCTLTDLCSNRRCALSGAPCGAYYDCEVDTGDYCVGYCSLSGLTCIPQTDVGCEDVVDYCIDESQVLHLSLDLDASGGSGITDFFEGFESGDFGSFTAMNLDAGLANLESAEGYRCQYNDPATDGAANRTRNCYPGANTIHADAYFWQVDDGRAFSGTRSLYMGVEVGPGDYQTPAANLEAVGTTGPINLAWGRCSVSSDLACSVDLECLGSGETCVALHPELSFKHQVSLMDDRWQNTRGHSSAAHGVVQVQDVDAPGTPAPPWRTIEPKVNRYDSFPTTNYFNCFFDPIDDGSSETDLFDYRQLDPPVGMAPNRYISVGGWTVDHAEWDYYGPSSNCYPQWVFASAGDTDEPFDPDNLNGPVSGPGLEGELGHGTWVEPIFNLDEYRGRRVRLRFLTSSVKLAEDAELQWAEELAPEDDGWWIDDVTVTHTLIEPATVSVDTKDNASLLTDLDDDFVGDDLDCSPTEAHVWSTPGEVLGLKLSHSGGAGGTTSLTWGPPVTMGATSVDYVVVSQDDGGCSESAVGASRSASDSATPAPGGLRLFLVRAENDCGSGPLGVDSLDVPRGGCQ